MAPDRKAAERDRSLQTACLVQWMQRRPVEFPCMISSETMAAFPVGAIGPDGLPLAKDQRGMARAVGNGCDIGAFEYGAKVPWLYLPLIFRN
jgi:hypothetical protein